jgi:hypothetical protein
MKQEINPITTLSGLMIFFLFCELAPVAAWAQESRRETDHYYTASATILSVAATVGAEQLSISYNGISSRGEKSYNLKEELDLNRSDVEPGLTFEKPRAGELKLAEKLKQASEYFLKHVTFDDLSSEDKESKINLKSKINTDNTGQSDFGFNLSLNITGDDDAILKMNAVTLESYGYHTFFNLVYDYEKKEVEFGVSSAHVNQYLLDGMRLEVQANPVTATGAVLMVMRF